MQATYHLGQADFLPGTGTEMWDSSALVAESSVTGRAAAGGIRI
jgi:hypothetical protein